MPYAVAEETICDHAQAELIATKAKRFIDAGQTFDDCELNKHFWWAGAAPALKRNWDAGHFETLRAGHRRQAFGVTFRRSDIERLVSASAAAAAHDPDSAFMPGSSLASISSPEPSPAPARKTVFIGHGHSEEWRKLAMFLHSEHDLNYLEFNSGGSPVGISITDHLQSMLHQADFALILTGDDEQATGALNPRLNVVHEAGLFQAKLGFRKAILFFEEGCKDFSNVHGLTAVRFPKGNIDAQFHEATRVLKREEVI